MSHPIDLHSHSTASDGIFSPSQLVARAYQKGVTTLALTDHDTIDGLAEAQTTATQLAIKLIRGVEISCVWHNITIHVLGYNFSLTDASLAELLKTLKEARWTRAKAIASKLANKGMKDILQQAIACQNQPEGCTNPPGRPHFAEAMIKLGYVKSQKEAFQKWLGTGKIGDIKQHWPEFETIVEQLQSSEAWLSLAHPCQYNMTRTKLCRLLKEFVALGGQSIEVVNGFQPAEQVGKLANLARDFGLLCSAGSDFHRPNTWSELGIYRHMPEDLPALWHKFAT